MFIFRLKINGGERVRICELCEVVCFCSDACRNASVSEGGDHDGAACARFKEQAKIFELEASHGGDVLFKDECRSRCQMLERLEVHKKGVFRRECDCFDFVPFGELERMTKETQYKSQYVHGKSIILEEGSNRWNRWLISNKEVDEDYKLQYALVDFLPLTIAWAFRRFVQPCANHEQNSNLKIFIVGCEKEFDSIEHISNTLYELLFDADDEVDAGGKLEVHFIGPELSRRMDNLSFYFYEGKVKACLHRGLLGSGTLSDDDKEVDLIFAPNAGVAVFQKEWHDAFRWCFKKHGKKPPPFIFTDYTYEASFRGCELLRKWCHFLFGQTDDVMIKVLDVKLNPWRQPLLRNSRGGFTNVKRVPGYSSGFIFGAFQK